MQKPNPLQMLFRILKGAHVNTMFNSNTGKPIGTYLQNLSRRSGNFKQNQRKERKISRRRKMKASAR